MKKIKLLLIISVLLQAQLTLKSQSNVSLSAGTIMEIQTGADACADTRTIAGVLTGNGTWCLLPLTPAAPLQVSPANLSTGLNLSLNLIWQKSLGTVAYRIQLSTDSLFNTLIINDSTVTDSSKSVSGLTPLTYYWWRVSAKGIGGTSSYSTVRKFRTLGYPNPLTLINPPNNSVNQPVSILFRWSKATEQFSPFVSSKVITQKNEQPLFKVSGGDNTDGIDAISNYWFDMVTDTSTLANLTRDSLLTDTTKSLSGLINNTNYFWRVKAKNQVGWGSYSIWYKFTTILAAPAPPVLVSPLNNAIGQNLSLPLVWNKSVTASNYRVQVSTDSLFAVLIINDSTLTDSTRLVSGLNPLTNYWWRVNAKNAGGTSSYSLSRKFRTLGSPTQVTLLNPPNNAVNQPLSIQFRWSRALDQTFALSRSEKKSEKVNSTENINSPEISVEGDVLVSNYWWELTTDTVSFANLQRDTLLTDTTKTAAVNSSSIYFWRAKAKNQLGWGAFTSWFRFTTSPLPPANVNLTVIPGGFYNPGTGKLNMKDTIRVYLVDSASCLTVDSARGVVDSLSFQTAISFSNASSGNYYMIIYHRNHIAVATRYKTTVTRGSTVNYNFTTDSSKAFGFNMAKISTSPVLWGMIPGDANRDGFVDGLDQTIWLNENGFDGYLQTDFNGDAFVDGLDQTVWLLYNGNSSFLPCGFTLDPVTKKMIINTPDFDIRKNKKVIFDTKRKEDPAENNMKQNNSRK